MRMDATPQAQRFSLRRLALWIMSFVLVSAGATWSYRQYIYATPLGPEDNLADYVGRNVTWTGKYETVGDESPLEFVYFGSEPIHIFGGGGNRNDGRTIVVTGRLGAATPYFSGLVSGSGRPAAYHLYSATWHEAKYER
jgi:hypothetical protein